MTAAISALYLITGLGSIIGLAFLNVVLQAVLRAGFEARLIAFGVDPAARNEVGLSCKKASLEMITDRQSPTIDHQQSHGERRLHRSAPDPVRTRTREVLCPRAEMDVW